LNEQALISGLRQGDEQALRMLLQQQGPSVYRLLIRSGCQPEDAEELLQDVMLSAFRNIRQFREDASLRTWLYRLTTNRLHDFWRYQQRSKRKGWHISLFRTDSPEPIAELPSTPPADGKYDENRHRELLQAALDQLPQQQKSAFLLTQEGGYSYEEAAGILGVSKSSLESLVFRARQNLRKRLEHHYKK